MVLTGFSAGIFQLTIVLPTLSYITLPRYPVPCAKNEKGCQLPSSSRSCIFFLCAKRILPVSQYHQFTEQHNLQQSTASSSCVHPSTIFSLPSAVLPFFLALSSLKSCNTIACKIVDFAPSDIQANLPFF